MNDRTGPSVRFSVRSLLLLALQIAILAAVWHDPAMRDEVAVVLIPLVGLLVMVAFVLLLVLPPPVYGAFELVYRNWWRVSWTLVAIIGGLAARFCYLNG